MTGVMNAGAILAAAESQSPAQPDAPVLPVPTVGKSGDTAEMEAVTAEDPRRRRRWLKPAIIGGTALVVLAGAAAGGFYYTQQQYYVGADGSGHVAIYQGVDYSLAGIKLSHVYTTAEVTVAGLPTSEQTKVDGSITATSLTDAKTIVSTLSIMESDCAALAATPSISPSSTPSATTSPTVSSTPHTTGTAKATGKATATVSGKASASSSVRSSETASPTTSPAATPAPSVTPSSSVSSGSTDLRQLSAECPGNSG